MRITYNDISKRIRNRDNKSGCDSFTPRIYTEHNVFCTNNAIDAIMNWESLAETSNEAFDKALDIFDEVCINENRSAINHCLQHLAENVVKVRDASQLMRSLKNRSGRMKKKISTKIKGRYDPVSDAIGNSINAINKALSKNGVNLDTKTIEESYRLLYNEAKKAKECDRIVENYANVSRRFNIDRIISEISYPNDIYHAVLEIARCMDTYNIPFKSKYCNALEISNYALSKNNMNYPNDKIIEAVTDYFIFSSGLSESNLEDIKEVKDISVIFGKDDFDSINYFFDQPEEFEDNTATDLVEAYCSPFNEKFTLKKDIKIKEKEIKKAGRDLAKAARQGNPDERLDRKTKKEIDDFRKECAKDPDNKNNITRLKSLVSSIFTKSPYQIVYELPNFFSIIRGSFVIVSTYINPVVGLLAFITNQILKMALSRKQTEKIVKAYQAEIDSVKAKLDKTTDKETKSNLEKYLEELNKDYAKIKEYENNLYTDDENYERDTSTEYNGEDEDDDFDDWDDFDFEEAASIVYIADIMQSIQESLINDNIDGIVNKNVYKLDNDTIDALTDFSITVPVILEKDKLCESLKEHRESLRGSSDIRDYIRIDCLNENITKLESDATVYATSSNLNGIRCYLACLNELALMNASDNYIMEMDFTNTLKLAIDRLKKTAVNLKDKEKQASNTIDVSVNNISKGIETALMNDNRDAVINGRILPSASKCIKIACAFGVSWAINPAIAVIGAIGALACSKKLKSKERQLIMDDIDIELKMVDRYIKQAEDDGDLKKVRQLELMQRNLQRQQQRIKYRMHVVYNQKVPNVADNDD